MKELFPQQPFYERQECFASLMQGEYSADDLQVIIEFPLHKQGEIIGHVIGTQATYDKIARVSNANGPDLRFASHRSEHNPYELCSEKVQLGTVVRRTIITDLQGASTYIVAELHFQELSVKHYIEPRKETDRHLTFFLAGPTTFWGVYEWAENSFTGERKNEVGNKPIELEGDLPFSAEVYPHYLHDKTPSPESFEISTRVYAIHLHTVKPVNELADQEFVELAKPLIEDSLLIASFASKRWITWYRYELLTPDALQTVVRRGRDATATSIDFQDSLVELRHGREFFKKGLKRLQELRSRNFNLFMPLVYYISGNEAKYVEEQFATLFLALERLKDMFTRSMGTMRTIIDEDKFTSLRNDLEATIKQGIGDAGTRALMYGKLLELNRPAFRVVLEQMMETYHVDWSDLYPKGYEPSLVKTRDRLFHSSEEVDIDLLIRELHRLRILLERFLLSMLDWRDFSRSPNDYEKKWLTKEG
jgi:hypothetical protein